LKSEKKKKRKGKEELLTMADAPPTWEKAKRRQSLFNPNFTVVYGKVRGKRRERQADNLGNLLFSKTFGGVGGGEEEGKERESTTWRLRAVREMNWGEGREGGRISDALIGRRSITSSGVTMTAFLYSDV